VQPPRERIFNVPLIVVLTAAVLGLVHAVFYLLLNEQQFNTVMIVLAFIPARYELAVLAAEPWWIGWGAAIWTFVTYAFLHGNLSHLFFNLVWLLAFGTPVARRFGTTRFVVFMLATAAVGALVHLLLNFGDRAPVIGASAAISAAMAAAMRFAFQRGGPIGALGSTDPAAYRVPAAPLATMLRDRRILGFIAVWFAINFVFGSGIVSMPGAEGNIAWEAHIGGFLAGLFGFALFDPVHPQPDVDTAQQIGHESAIISENDKP
jgi:membrane associated rhomboid family serine protease